MSFAAFQPHPGMRSQPVDTYHQPAFYEPGIGFRHPTYSSGAPTFGPVSMSARSFQAQSFSTPTSNSQVRFMSRPQTWQRDRGGRSSIEPFIDATKRVGPTGFSVLKIKNVSRRCQNNGPGIVFCASRSSCAPSFETAYPSLCRAHLFCRFRTMSPDQKLSSSLVKSLTSSRITPWAVRYT
jgi:hypothetical protein